MTEEEILAMEAGRELDALVVQKVIGSTPVTIFRPPPYSTDIAAAWHVKELLKFGDNETWFSFCEWVEEICGGDERILYQLNAEIICKSALLAKLGNNPL